MLGIGKRINLNAGIKVSFVTDIKYAFEKANIAERIIYFNVLLFLITALFSTFVFNWFALPSSVDGFITKPWTLISYAFIHGRLLHVLSNLLVLYYIGNLFLDFFNQKQFVSAYFSGIVIGGLAFLANNYFSNKLGAPLGGASAAVSTIFVAIATKIPRYAIQLRFIGSVELWVLAAIWVVLSILQLVNVDNGGAIAHLSGAVFGYFYALQSTKGNDLGKVMGSIISFFTDFFKTGKKSNLNTVYKSATKTSKDEISKTKQRKIDDILDKISKSGYDSLSKEEKDFLFRAGKK